MPLKRLIVSTVALMLGTPAVAQGTAFAPVAPFGDATLQVPLAFDHGAAPEPALSARDEQFGTFTAEWISSGETLDNWGQMQALTAFEDLRANNPEAQPAALLRALRVTFLNRYIRACAVTPVAEPVPIATPVGAIAAEATYMGCPHVRETDQSEEMVVVALLGPDHGYALQWSERDTARADLPLPPATRWQTRASFLAQARLCAESGDGADDTTCP